MITKQQINDCNDGQQLADWAAEYCMEYKKGYLGYHDSINHTLISDWQPHQPTETGKAQCWDLMIKYKMELDFDQECVSYPIGSPDGYLMFEYVDVGESWQEAVLKAAIISVIGC